MFEAKIREYFQGAYDHFRIPSTEAPETVKLVFSMELLTISSMSEVRSEHQVYFWASKGFLSSKQITLGSVTSDRRPILQSFLKTRRVPPD